MCCGSVQHIVVYCKEGSLDSIVKCLLRKTLILQHTQRFDLFSLLQVSPEED